MAEYTGEYGVNIREGSRVELCPSTDLWMQGARFGQVEKIENGVAVVRMDHEQVRKLQRFTLDRLRIPRR